MSWPTDWPEKCLDLAQKMGAMSAAGILSLVCMAQAWIIRKKENFTEVSNEKWRLTRDSAIRAEEGQTLVMGRVVDNISMNTSAVNALSARVDHLSTIIEERVPRRTT